MMIPRSTYVSAVVAAAVLASSLLSSASISANGAQIEATAVTAVEPTVAKTLVIGIDGATFDSLEPADTPVLDQFRAESTTSISNLYGADMAGTWSGPGWSSIATGVWPDKHRVTGNAFTSANFSRYPNYLSRINAALPDRVTAAYGTWSPITADIFSTGVDVRVANTTDAATTAAATEAIASGAADDLFVHLEDVDIAGHSVGTGGAAYRAALEAADAAVGQILAAAAERPASEDWTIIVTTDHGHTSTGGHGGNTLAERRVFVMAKAAGIPAGVTRRDAKLVDVAPTMLDAVGIQIQPSWELDGTSIASLEQDDFDAARPQLQSRVDEVGVPSTVLGWTQLAPSGWSIINSAMPTGGVTELRGWTFMTDDFFTSLEPGQWRETSVRGRDIIAVADSDEWDDKAHATGQFDSTLVSPQYPVDGIARANLVYATSYRVDGPQTATVTVTFDNGVTQTLKSYAAVTNTVERLSFSIPVGAQAAQFSFRYTGQNSAYWMVDAVSVEDEIRADEILYAVNAGGLPTADWTVLKGLAAADGTDLSNSVAEQPYGLDTVTGTSWGYVSSGSGIEGASSGSMFSTLRYAVSGRDLTYRFSGLAPGAYEVHAGYYDPWTQYADRGARVVINGNVRASDHPFTGQNRAVTYSDVMVGGDGELNFTLSKSRTPDVQLSWILVSRSDSSSPLVVVSSTPADPSGEAGWFTGDAWFTASASDPSGISVLEYRVDGGPWQQYTAPVIAGEGETVFEARAVDTMGNTSDVHTLTIRRDGTPPVSSARLTQQSSAVEVALSAEDTGSGVSKIEFRIDDGEWTQYAGPISFTTAGARSIEYRGIDVAGNAEAPQTVGVAVPFPVYVTVATRCLGAKVYVATSVRNDGSGPLNIHISNPFGAKVFSSVSPGKTVSLATNTRSVSVSADSVTVSATPVGGAEGVSEVYDYDARSCAGP